MTKKTMGPYSSGTMGSVRNNIIGYLRHESVHGVHTQQKIQKMVRALASLQDPYRSVYPHLKIIREVMGNKFDRSRFEDWLSEANERVTNKVLTSLGD